MAVAYNIKRTSVDANMHIVSITTEYQRPTTIWWHDDNGNRYYISLYLEDADNETAHHIWNAVQGRYWDAEEYYVGMDGDTACVFTPSETEAYNDEYMRHVLFSKGTYTGQIFVSNGAMYQPEVEQYAVGDNCITYHELVPTVEWNWFSLDDIPY